MKHWRSSILKYLLLLLFAGYWGSITLFPHTHIVDGVSIVHSHAHNPFGKEDSSTHTHTKTAFILITQISQIATIVFFLVLFSVSAQTLQLTLLPERKKALFYSASLFFNGLRGPPVL